MAQDHFCQFQAHIQDSRWGGSILNKHRVGKNTSKNLRDSFGGIEGGGFNLSLFLSHLGMGQAFLAISVRV